MTLRDDVPTDSAPPAGKESFMDQRTCFLLCFMIHNVFMNFSLLFNNLNM